VGRPPLQDATLDGRIVGPARDLGVRRVGVGAHGRRAYRPVPGVPEPVRGPGRRATDRRPPGGPSWSDGHGARRGRAAGPARPASAPARLGAGGGGRPGGDGSWMQHRRRDRRFEPGRVSPHVGVRWPQPHHPRADGLGGPVTIHPRGIDGTCGPDHRHRPDPAGVHRSRPPRRARSPVSRWCPPRRPRRCSTGWWWPRWTRPCPTTGGRPSATGGATTGPPAATSASLSSSPSRARRP
jgi:hypothetical protein